MKIKLLEYYVSKNGLFAFLFSKDPFIFKVAKLPINLDELRSNAENFLKYINDTSANPPLDNPYPDQWHPFSDGWGNSSSKDLLTS